MAIRTKEFQPTKSEYFRVLVQWGFDSLWVYTLILIVLAIVSVGYLFLLGIIIVDVAVLLFLLAYIWLYPKSRKKEFFQKKFYEIGENYFEQHLGNGNVSKIELDKIVKVRKKSTHYTLTVLGKFYYLPQSAFSSESDIEAFDSLLKKKKLIK